MATAFSLAKSCGLIGLQWAFDSQLYNGSYATLADYSALIHGKTLAGRLPEITALAVNQGGAGTSVKILGRRLTGATGVRFGLMPAAGFTVVNDSTIEAKAPDLVGAQDITVSSPVGTSARSDGDLYTGYHRPVVSGVSPSSGSPSGGTRVTVTGNNFAGACAVLFGPTPARSFTVVSSTKLVVTSPAGTSQHNVSVMNPAGTSKVVPADRFTWLPGPAASESPASGNATMVPAAAPAGCER
jgi:hypothetical protein